MQVDPERSEASEVFEQPDVQTVQMMHVRKKLWIHSSCCIKTPWAGHRHRRRPLVEVQSEGAELLFFELVGWQRATC